MSTLDSVSSEPLVRETDVAIAGAGLGGLAAGIFLRQAGMRVICVEPEPFPHARVGESLDWSAPALLKAMGILRDELTQDGCAIYKRKIRLFPLDGAPFEGQPPDWLERRPLGFETTTIHVDRMEMDQRLYEQARSLGVEFLWDRVNSVQTDGDRVTGLKTASQGEIRARWFIDASGQVRVFPRAMKILRREYGQRKICTWTYFKTDTHYDGTSFHGDQWAPYLSWIWEIPINRNTISVGWIISAEEYESRRRRGASAGQTLREELARYERFRPLLTEQPDAPVQTCSFRCYVHDRVCGPNWVLVGEAASLPDPLTGNGVTAAFRHAQDAVRSIVESRERDSFTPRQMRVYETNVRSMGHLFNHGVEVGAYQGTMRRAFGAFPALQLYTLFAYLMNALYNKFRPEKPFAMACFTFLYFFFRVWFTFWPFVGRLLLRVTGGKYRPNAGQNPALGTS